MQGNQGIGDNNNESRNGDDKVKTVLSPREYMTSPEDEDGAPHLSSSSEQGRGRGRNLKKRPGGLEVDFTPLPNDGKKNPSFAALLLLVIKIRAFSPYPKQMCSPSGRPSKFLRRTRSSSSSGGSTTSGRDHSPMLNNFLFGDEKERQEEKKRQKAEKKEHQAEKNRRETKIENGNNNKRRIQNDYCQHFVDSGLRPQNFLGDLEKKVRYDGYPEYRKLVDGKDIIVSKRATPAMSLKCDLKQFDLQSLGSKFDVPRGLLKKEIYPSIDGIIPSIAALFLPVKIRGLFPSQTKFFRNPLGHFNRSPMVGIQQACGRVVCAARGSDTVDVSRDRAIGHTGHL